MTTYGGTRMELTLDDGVALHLFASRDDREAYQAENPIDDDHEEIDGLALFLTPAAAHAVAALIANTVVESSTGRDNPGSLLLDILDSLEAAGIQWFESSTAGLIIEADNVKFADYPEGFEL